MCWYFLSFFFCYLLFLVDVVFYLTHVTRRRWLFGRTVPYPWWTCTSTTRNRRRTSDRSTSASNTISKTRLSFWKSCRSVGHFLFLSFFFFCWKISILIFILQSSFSWFVSLFPFIFFLFFVSPLTRFESSLSLFPRSCKILGLAFLTNGKLNFLIEKKKPRRRLASGASCFFLFYSYQSDLPLEMDDEWGRLRKRAQGVRVAPILLLELKRSHRSVTSLDPFVKISIWLLLCVCVSITSRPGDTRCLIKTPSTNQPIESKTLLFLFRFFFFDLKILFQK